MRWKALHLFATFLLGEKDGVDVGYHTTGSNGGTGGEFVQFFVVTDSQLDVTGDNTGAFVVTGGARVGHDLNIQ